VRALLSFNKTQWSPIMSSFRLLLAPAALVVLALSTPSHAQCIPDRFPADWLQQQENDGGHTIARHVGKTDQQLIARVTPRRGPRAAGSFPASQPPAANYAAAQATIAAQLGPEADAINAWADDAEEGDRRADDYASNVTIGRVAARVPGRNPVVMNTCTFRTVLEANGDGTCYLLTAFPTVPPQGVCP
jgi:hypothetical protein